MSLDSRRDAARKAGMEGSLDSRRDAARRAGMEGSLASRTVVALVHHPVLDRTGKVITTAITNLDIHDLARSSRTYGLAAYHLITPVAAQRELATRIIDHWKSGEGAAMNDFRRQALDPVTVFSTVEDSRAAVEKILGAPPLVVATSARSLPNSVGYRALPADPLLATRPLLILMGTGWGLADEVVDRVDRVLAPIQGGADYNHLSVRSDAAIILDRLFGDRD